MKRREIKANACAQAFRALYGRSPTKHAVVMICAVAEHETNCGDAWNHSGCWGAVQRRAMTAAEKALVKADADTRKSLTPQERADTPALLLPPRDAFEGLHGDSSPINGKYQAWYWHFPANVVCPYSAGLSGDAAGAWRLMQVILVHEPETLAAIDTIDSTTLAANMYRHGYYEGFHDPRKPGGKEANVADYARALIGTSACFSRDLAAWLPDPPYVDVTTTAGVQRALNVLGCSPALSEDGVYGPKTRMAVSIWQGSQRLKADGIVGPKTRAALVAALLAVHPS